jgi:hypothetical protein
MAISDYASLKTAVQARGIRSDLTALVPDFIRSAHDEIVNRVTVCADLSLTAATTALPSDFRLLVALMVDSNPAAGLELGNTSQVANLGSGVPRYYSVSGSTLTVAPTPDITYAGRALYKLSRTMFSADADTNTALTRFPFLYFDGAMAELYAHVRNTDEETKYRQKFEAGIGAANDAGVEDFWGGAPLQPIPGVVV